MLITVSGPAGSGKTTFAEALADALEYDYVSGGDIFRSLADERGHSLVEFNKLAEEDDQVDRDLDRRLREIASERDDIVLESRLAGWMAGDHADLKFWLDAPFEVRIDRIADREDKSAETARRETSERAESEAKRYQEYYNIDIEDRSIYDLVINTARWSPETEVEIALSAVESYDPADDEGKTPVTAVEYDF
ncbi:(d)CMP kinase [Halosimplex aquaticum]|uniref:Cytidylate kinase n=1 Tax=Halosimplex aquaticum TaxID=3026162 RepID=A0ABD5Y4C4_9EURY|nr:AAA family ATPase [Halosimplex aquaticum]